MKLFTVDQLVALEIGSAILGSGGGGDPAIEKLAAQVHLDRYGPASMIETSDLSDDDLVIPVAFMGAPSVGIEMLTSGCEFDKIFYEIEKYFGRKPSVIMPAEIGGSNAFVPLQIASKHNMCILDADGIGRAFPELQMSVFNLNNVSIGPAFISNRMGDSVVIDLLNQDSYLMESIARSITITLGSSAAIALYIMSGAQAKQSVVSGSLSRALSIGTCIVKARNERQDPVQALVKKEDAHILAHGTIRDINQKIIDGFLRGVVHIESAQDDTFILEYQNEHLLASHNGIPLACTPDIIMLVDAQTAQPITVESMKFGMQVSIIVLPSDKIWMSQEGLKLIGPRAFKYDFDYFPFQQQRGNL